MADEHAKASVFAAVDQEQMISRIETSPADDTETHFFDQVLAQTPSTDALDSGIRVFGGEPTAPAPESADEAVVVFTGDFAGNPAARRAFILHGPPGVARPVG